MPTKKRALFTASCAYSYHNCVALQNRIVALQTHNDQLSARLEKLIEKNQVFIKKLKILTE